ncbi:MAG: L-serine ammonia-lyase, iron-sulfur-dependent, subunit alpha [Oscillospiraceae bacterium]|nr:L-serine ammonia-lyase, iron-sulfur-dependent, subunit alpha [Oscillospiraceae bacterium]
MKSIRDIYKIGKGPSSSHTMGPERAAKIFLERYPDASRYRVTLYDSLSKTGRGHGTDRVLYEVLGKDRTVVIFAPQQQEPLPHPNTLDFQAYDGEKKVIGKMRVFSVGGGDIVIDGEPASESPDIYPENSFAEIAQFCRWRYISLAEYVELNEGPEIWDFLAEIWRTMKRAIYRGMHAEGVLPGGLHVERKAKYLFNQEKETERPMVRELRIICSYAYATAEENADNGVIVTAPTCGACGVLPAVLLYMQEHHNFSNLRVLEALAAAGLIGTIVKRNASISGAECGCQAEIGTACSMAAAALAEVYGLGLEQVEYAAEIAMEHHLGLTCDPICGLVQVPCIERNAVAAKRAMDAFNLASFLTGTRNISFDMVVRTMKETGVHINSQFRETSEGGLAKFYERRSAR